MAKSGGAIFNRTWNYRENFAQNALQVARITLNISRNTLLQLHSPLFQLQSTDDVPQRQLLQIRRPKSLCKERNWQFEARKVCSRFIRGRARKKNFVHGTSAAMQDPSIQTQNRFARVQGENIPKQGGLLVPQGRLKLLQGRSVMLQRRNIPTPKTLV